MKVKAGQKWRHVPSGDVRYVRDVVTYEEVACAPRRQFEIDFGITHVARMVQIRESDGFIARDCRDSSDMMLVDGQPFHPVEWVMLP